MPKTFKDSLNKALQGYENEIESVMLYSNIFNEKHLMVVLKDTVPFSAVEKFKKLKFLRQHVCELKLFFYGEFLNALDVFPLEFIQLKEKSALIFGRDVLEGILISRDNFRHQCEFYLRSNLLSAREHYLKNTLSEKEIIRHSMNQLLLVLSVIHNLIEIEWEEKHDLTRLLDAIAISLKIDVSLLKTWLQDPKQIQGKHLSVYLELLANLIAKIDAL